MEPTYHIPDKCDLWHEDCLLVADYYEEKDIALLLTSTPYPGQRGFDLNVQEYMAWWALRLGAWLPRMAPDGVIVQVVKFKRREDGRFDTRIFDLVRLLEHDFGLHCIDVYPWDKLNAPPNGNHHRWDRDAYEFCFAFGMTSGYYKADYRQPYAEKTVGKAASGNMRQADVAGSLAGGHADLHPGGALQDNVLRISSSGDQNRPRVRGGVFPQELADRFILEFSRPGDWVLDVCMGSGTVPVRAVRHGRFAIGIDIYIKAFLTACVWMDQHTNFGPLFEGRNDGQRRKGLGGSGEPLEEGADLPEVGL